MEQIINTIPVAIGIYIIFRHLKYVDISTDGVFTFGGFIFAYSFLVLGLNETLSLCVALIAGGFIGILTGFLHIVLNISKILSGVITLSALYSINLLIFGKSNVFIDVNDFSAPYRVITSIAVIIVCILMFKIRLGYDLNTYGNNKNLIDQFGGNSSNTLFVGLFLGNAFIALSGAMTTFYLSFIDSSIGIGTLIDTVAILVIAIGLSGYTKFKNFLGEVIAIVISCAVYILALNFIVNLSVIEMLDSKYIKLVSAAIVVITYSLLNKSRVKRVLEI